MVNVSHSVPHDDHTTEFHTNTGPFTLVPISKQAVAIVCVVRPEEAERLVALNNVELALALEKRAHHILGKFKLLGKPQVFPLATVIANKFVAPRCVLVGESAHQVPPIGAQGFNMSLADVAALGDFLDRPDWDNLHWFDAYDRQRRQDVQRRHNAVNLMNQSLLQDFLPGQIVRSLGISALNNVPYLRKALMQQGMGLDAGRISGNNQDLIDDQV